MTMTSVGVAVLFETNGGTLQLEGDERCDTNLVESRLAELDCERTARMTAELVPTP